MRDLVNQKPPRIPTNHVVRCSSDYDHCFGHADLVEDNSWSKLGREIDVGFFCDSNALATNMDQIQIFSLGEFSLTSFLLFEKVGARPE